MNLNVESECLENKNIEFCYNGFDSQNLNNIEEKNKSFRESLSDVLIVNRSSSSISAGWNITNIIQGIGILGLPYAMMKGSWLSIALNAIAAFISCSTGNMIIDCMYEKLDNNNMRIKIHDDYPDLGKRVWPKFGKAFVATTSVIEMFGASTLYLILMGISLSTLFKDLLPSMTQQHWLVLSALVVLTTLFIKKLSIISWFSFIAVIGLFSTLITILIYCFTQLHSINVNNFPPIIWENIPISTGIIVFSYCAHPVLPAIESSMKTPENFPKVLTISFIVAVITKTIFGLIPVFIFGEGVDQTISDNVPLISVGFYLTSKIFVLINAFFSLPLVIYVLSDRLDQALLIAHFHPILWPQGRLHLIWILMSRLVIILMILLTALIVPYFALVMSFIGSITGTSLAFLLPCWFSLVIQHRDLSILQKLYRVFIIIFGTFIGIVGMIYAGREILNVTLKNI